MNRFYYIVAFTCITLLTTTAKAQDDCANVGFETSSLTNWQGYTGNCCPINTTVSGIVPGRHTVMTGPGFDPQVPTIPVVSPYGGTYSVKLGNETVGGEAERLTYSFTVTPANTNFTYQYAVILQDPNHDISEQPRFEAKITDQNGTVIQAGYYFVIATANVPGFQTLNSGSGTIIYKDWSLVAVDLTAYIGQTLNISFQTGDCGLGAHFGYAYIDAGCRKLEVKSDYCLGDTSTEMEAPEGFQYYLWSNGDTTSTTTISQPVPGATYTVTCRPFHDNNVPTVLSYTIPQAFPFAADFSIVADCNSTNASLSDSTTLIDNSTQLSSWQWIVDGALVSNQQQVSHNFIQAGTHDVTVIVKDSKGCVDTTSRQIMLEPMQVTPLLSTTQQYNGYGVSCIGANDGVAKVGIANGEGPFNYSWNTGNTTDSVSNLQAGSYAVTVTDNEGCIVVANVPLSSPPSLTANPAVQNILCYGQSSGSIQLNAAGGAGSIITDWPHDSQLHTGTATNLSAGTYSVTVTDANNCTLSTSVSVTEPAAGYSLLNTITDATAFGECDGTISLTNVTGNTAPYTYAWSTTPVQSSATASQLCAGIYSVTISDQNNCTTTATFAVTEPQETGIKVVGELSAVSIWPNPHKEALQLNNVPQGIYTLTVNNTIGQQVLNLSNTQPDATGNIKLDMEALAKGIYFITLSNSTSTVTIQAVKE